MSAKDRPETFTDLCGTRGTRKPADENISVWTDKDLRVTRKHELNSTRKTLSTHIHLDDLCQHVEEPFRPVQCSLSLCDLACFIVVSSFMLASSM